MLRCEEAVAPYGQRIFRPPFAHQTIGSHLDALLLAYTVVTYSLHAFDWENRDAGSIADRLIRRLSPGSIILLHDALWEIMHEGAEDRTAMLDAVDRFLDTFTGTYRFVTVPELMQYGRAARRNWYVRDHADWQTPNR